MPIYLWTAKDTKGVENALKVNAPTAQEARTVLEGQGYTDLKLIKDDLMAEFTAKSEVVSNLSAAEQVKTLSGGKTTLSKYVYKVARDIASTALICGALIWWRWTRHDVIGMVVYSSILAVTAAVIAAIRLNSYLFARMIQAREWHRADDVLRLLRWMDALGKLTHAGLRSEDAARYRSLALIWKGRTYEGFADWQQHESKLKPWSYLSHLSGLYDQSGDIDRALQCAKQSVAQNPQVGALVTDLAWKYLLHERNLPRAKEAIEQSEKLEQTEIAKPFMIRNRGVLALREGRAEEAEKLLQEALAMWDAKKGQHFRYANMMLTKGFLCQARSRLGKLPQARKDFAEAKPWLEAAKVTGLLNACHGCV
jgi:tetratricopeptide (TPR) repeat protein